jgi:hypothetical protein
MPICTRCKLNNPPMSAFCNQCGNQFVYQTAPQAAPFQPKKITRNQLFLIFGVGGFFALLVGVSLVADSLKQKRTPESQPQTLASTQTNTAPAAPVPPAPPTFAELKSKSGPLLSMERDEYKQEDVKQFDDVMQPLREIPKDSKDYKESQVLLKKLIDKSAKVGAEMLVLGPKPENSAYDGSVRVVDKYLEKVLNDYHNSEYVEWSPVTKIYIGKEPYWGVRLKLRAKNAFGGYILRDTFYFMRNGQVVISKGLNG